MFPKKIPTPVISFPTSPPQIPPSGLQDEQRKVKTMTALALAALAEAATPYGIEAFDGVLRPLWKGILDARDKDLAAFLKAIGYIVPLMDGEHANFYTKDVMIILIREFSTSDDEMRKIVGREEEGRFSSSIVSRGNIFSCMMQFS